MRGWSGGGLTDVLFLPVFPSADGFIYTFFPPYLHPSSPWGHPTMPLGRMLALTPVVVHVDMREDGELRQGSTVAVGRDEVIT